MSVQNPSAHGEDVADAGGEFVGIHRDEALVDRRIIERQIRDIQGAVHSNHMTVFHQLGHVSVV